MNRVRWSRGMRESRGAREPWSEPLTIWERRLEAAGTAVWAVYVVGAGVGIIAVVGSMISSALS